MKLIKQRKNQSSEGYVLMVVLTTIIPVAAISAAMTMLLSSKSSHVQVELTKEQMLASAESVAFEGMALLNGGAPLTSFPLADASLQHPVDGIDNDGDGLIDEADEIGEVRLILDWGTDQIDNDFDGFVDEDDEDVHCLVTNHRRDQDGINNDGDSQTDEPDENYMLTLKGVASPFLGNVGTRELRVEAYAQFSQALMPGPPAALYLGDPNARISFNGSTFLVSGNDVDINGNVTGVQLPGIGVEGPTATVVNELNRNQNSLVVGQGPNPSVFTVSVPNPFGLSTSFIEDWITLYRPIAHYNLTGGTVTANPEGTDGIDNDGDGLVDEPDESWFGGGTQGMQVTYTSGNLHFSGNNIGSGLLLVDGNLAITGSFQWRGIVVVRGDFRISGGGNTQKMIEGSAFVGADVTEGNNTGTVTVGGNVVIQYAQHRINEVTNTLGRWRLWAFKEDSQE